MTYRSRARHRGVTIFLGVALLAASLLAMAPSANAGTADQAIVVGKGPGNQPMVRTFRGDGTPTAPFAQQSLVYPKAFPGGVFTSFGSADGSRFIVTGAGAGGGPQVRLFDGFSGAEIFSFFAFAEGFTGGVRVGTGDVNNDSWDDVIVGAGPGGSPHVRVFNGAAIFDTATPALDEMFGFFAFAPGFTGGVYVASGNTNGDNNDDIIVGAGSGGGPHVRGWSGADGSDLHSFFPFAGGFSGGVRVAVGNIDDSGEEDIIVGAGPGGGPHVRVFEGLDETPLMGFFAYAGGFSGGVFVAATPLNGFCDFIDEVVTGAGSGGGPHVRGFAFGTDGAADPIVGFFAFEGEFGGGAQVGGNNFSFC